MPLWQRTSAGKADGFWPHKPCSRASMSSESSVICGAAERRACRRVSMCAGPYVWSVAQQSAGHAAGHARAHAFRSSWVRAWAIQEQRDGWGRDEVERTRIGASTRAASGPSASSCKPGLSASPSASSCKPARRRRCAGRKARRNGSCGWFLVQHLQCFLLCS